MPTIPPELAPHRRTTYIPTTIDGEGAPHGSRFGGRPWVRPGEAWPSCGSCGKPMQLFLQLNPADVPEAAREHVGDGLIQLFYCTSTAPLCEVDAEAWGPYAASVNARRIPIGEGQLATHGPAQCHPAKAITGWQPLDDYPHYEDMHALGIDLDDEAIDALYEQGALRDGDKLLGWPAWIQGAEYPNCLACGEPMEFLFQIDSEINVPWMFGDGGTGHLTRCAKHPDLLAFGWACS